MPVPRWWWVFDSEPWTRAHATAELEPEAAVMLPGPDVTPSYAEYIKSLFRERDRDSMRFVFDLWSYEDVRTHADAILERLRAGTMPGDGAWPSERVEVFARWVSSGAPA